MHISSIALQNVASISNNLLYSSQGDSWGEINEVGRGNATLVLEIKVSQSPSYTQASHKTSLVVINGSLWW